MLEDVARTRNAATFPVHMFLTEDDDLFKKEDSAVVKLQLFWFGTTARLRNKQAVLQQQPALCSYLPLQNIQLLQHQTNIKE